MRGSYADLWRRIGAALPERTAVVAGEDRITYAEFDDQASRLGSLMLDGGVHAGDRVAFFLYNRAEYLTAFNAVLKIGAVPVSINYRFRERELGELLEDCGAAALIYPSSLASVVDRLDGTVRPHLRLEVDDGVPGCADAVPFGNYRNYEPLPAPEAPRDGTLLVYTGGTTGRPKAVVWDEPDLLDIQIYSTYGTLGITEPQNTDEVVKIASEPGLAPTVTLPLAPFIHATALFNAMNTFLLGGTVVILPAPSLDPVRAVEVIRAEQVTNLIIAGDAVALPLLDALEAGPGGRMDHLRSVISSGMRFSDATKARMHAFGNVSVIDLLASTEGGPYAIAVSTRAEDLPARFRLTSGAVVVDLEMNELQNQPGETGVLGYRGTLPRGYYRDEEKTRATYPVVNGRRYVIPGDYVRVQEDGYIELLGRGSSVVNTGGEKVFPAEVEEALMEHPLVLDAVVFGMPDLRWGEALTAMVAVDDPDRMEPDELLRFVGERLAGYKKPRRIIVRHSLERGPTGKLNMRALRQDAADTVPGESNVRINH